jgi:PX domain
MDPTQKSDPGESSSTTDNAPPEPPLSPTSPVSPPYWRSEDSEEQRNLAASFRAKISTGLGPGRILLEDNTEEDSESSRACWARSAQIQDYVIVGKSTGVGALGSYVVFRCTVETHNASSDSFVWYANEDYQGSVITLNKRYSEFEALRENLVQSFPLAQKALPKLPPKSVLSMSLTGR